MASIKAAVEKAFAVPISGWDFSWLRGRARETSPRWDYTKLVSDGLDDSGVSLDIDTGGGEFIERFAPVRGLLVVTEGYAPNVPVAARRLRPYGCRSAKAGFGTSIWTPPFGDAQVSRFDVALEDLLCGFGEQFGPLVRVVGVRGGGELAEGRSESAWKNRARRR